MGLGVTPSVWISSAKALQVGSIGAVVTDGTAFTIKNNTYKNSGGNDVYLTNGYASQYYQFESKHVWNTAASGTAGNAISFTQAMTLDASGRLGIGRTSVGAQLDVLGAASTSAMRIVGNSGASVYVDLSGGGDNYYDATNNIFRNASGTERARIDTSGNLLVGTSSLAGTGPANGVRGLYVLTSQNGIAVKTTASANSYECYSGLRNSTVGNVASWWYNESTLVGTISISSTATLYNTASDQRLKENIVDAESASSLIDSLKVRQFDWKTDNSHQRYGFVAQELVTVAPEAVYQPANEDDMMAVDYSKLVPMLVKEIQSLRQRVAQLESN
jgi:hypothetical protein